MPGKIEVKAKIQYFAYIYLSYIGVDLTRSGSAIELIARY